MSLLVAPKSTLTESQWQTQVISIAKMYGWTWYHTMDSRRSKPGFPDLILAKHGRAIAVELKTAKGKVSETQRMWLELLFSAGMEAAVWRPEHLEEVVLILGPRQGRAVLAF
jgi:hypothetical protein